MVGKVRVSTFLHISYGLLYGIRNTYNNDLICSTSQTPVSQPRPTFAETSRTEQYISKIWRSLPTTLGDLKGDYYVKLDASFREIHGERGIGSEVKRGGVFHTFTLALTHETKKRYPKQANERGYHRTWKFRLTNYVYPSLYVWQLNATNKNEIKSKV